MQIDVNKKWQKLQCVLTSKIQPIITFCNQLCNLFSGYLTPPHYHVIFLDPPPPNPLDYEIYLQSWFKMLMIKKMHGMYKSYVQGDSLWLIDNLSRYGFFPRMPELESVYCTQNCKKKNMKNTLKIKDSSRVSINLQISSQQKIGSLWNSKVKLIILKTWAPKIPWNFWKRNFKVLEPHLKECTSASS